MLRDCITSKGAKFSGQCIMVPAEEAKYLVVTGKAVEVGEKKKEETAELNEREEMTAERTGKAAPRKG